VSLGLAIGCLLGLALLGYLLVPLVREGGASAPAELDTRSELEDLYIQREGVYSTLKELEFDFETGKLMEEDFRELRSRYAAEAVRILARIDDLEGGEEPRSGTLQVSAPRAGAPQG
jgi:hypothetical protein